MNEAEYVRLKFIEWRNDPVAFCREFLNVKDVWSKQEEILRAIHDDSRVAVASAHGVGKTFIASCVAWWWMLCHDRSQSIKVVITAPSRSSAQELLAAAIIARWEDMTRLYPSAEEHDYLGLGEKPTQRGWRAPWSAESGMEWFATKEDEGKDTGHASRAAGRHADHLLFIFEEASGVLRTIWDSIEGSMFGSHRHLLAIGNPVDPTSEFARFYRSPSTHPVRVSALDCPRIVHGDDAMPYGPTRKAVEEAKRKYGEGSGMYQWKVLGLFPTSAIDTLMGYDEVRRALERKPPEKCSHHHEHLGIGCDVARFGDDRTVVYVVCRCGKIVAREERHGQDTMATTGLVILMAATHGMEKADAWRIAIDDTGVGGGVTDRARELGWRVRAENFGSKPENETNEERFVNRRAELWWRLRDWIRSTAAFADAEERVKQLLLDDLTSPKYSTKSDSRIVLEPKADIKERIGRSPDDADALALAVWGVRLIPQDAAPQNKAVALPETPDDIEDAEDDAKRDDPQRTRYGPLADVWGGDRRKIGW